MTHISPESEAFTITEATGANHDDLVVRASHPLWEENRASEHGLLFERILGGHATKDAPFPYEIPSLSGRKSPQTSDPHEMLLIRNVAVPLHNGRPDVHAFNERIEASSAARVNILPHPENDRLLIAHRTHAYGRLVVGAVKKLEFVQNAGIIGDDIPAEGSLAIYKAFTKGVVLGAVIDPEAAEIPDVQQNIHTLITQDRRPGNLSGL